MSTGRVRGWLTGWPSDSPASASTWSGTATTATEERDEEGRDEALRALQEREWELGVDEWIEWDIIPLTAEEQAEFAATVAGDIRNQRNWMLIQTDYIHSPDCQIADKGPWEVYRQALRDVPQQAGFPKTVTWPEAP